MIYARVVLNAALSILSESPAWSELAQILSKS